MIFRILFCFILGFSASLLNAQSSYTGAQLMAAVKAARPKGDVQIRATMRQKGKPTLQIVIKRHTSPNGDELHLYQVLFPTARKSEGLALRVGNGGKFSGWTYTPGGQPVSLKPTDRTTGLFGTDVLIEDLLAEFLDWPVQEVKQHVKLGSADCTIVESKPGGASPGNVSRVLSVMEDERLYPKKAEIFGKDGKLMRTVETQKVMRSSSGYFVPVEFSVINAANGSRTDVSGKGLTDNLKFTDDDFSDAALLKGVGVRD
ncbi:MAG: outer membrane lipoprotein-sorting protein [Verrucomicrobiaceae bacterium]|nr:outer membrane lipoprotein-sorting protein [Verrucomicrobiaceae bacterium]